MSDPCDGQWGEWGDRSEGAWGDGIFAAAAAAGHADILKLLIVEGCYKDEMGLKALELAIDSGSFRRRWRWPCRFGVLVPR